MRSRRPVLTAGHHTALGRDGGLGDPPTGGTPTPEPATLRAPERAALRWQGWVIGMVAMLSSFGALAADLHPTAAAPGDAAASALFGAGVVGASALAGPTAWVVAAALASGAATSSSIAWVPALLLASAARCWPNRLHRPLTGALVGALVVQAVLRLPADRLALNAAMSALSVVVLVLAAWSHVTRPTRARLRGPARVLAAALGLLVVGLVLSVALARQKVETGIERAQDGLAAVRRGDSAAATQRFEESSRAFRSAHGSLGAWWAQPSRLLPVVGQHVRSLDVLAGAGADLATASAISTEAADLDDLGFVGGRLDLDRLRSMAAPLEDVREAIERAQATTRRAASPWLVAPLADRLDAFQLSLSAAAADTVTAAEAIRVIPGLLGGDGPRAYFVAFGTPAESRELGGFMGAYAILLADDGKVRLGTTGRVRELNEGFAGRQLENPAALPPHLLALQPQRFWHNVTGTADFPTVAEAIGQLWPSKALGPLDGVLYMDPVALAGLLDLTGPVRVAGYDDALSADNAARFLLRDQYIAFPNDDRHDFLVDAAEQVFRRLTAGDLPPLGQLGDALAPAVQGRRFLVHSFHADEEELLGQLDIDGALPPVRGDFLSVRSSNRGLNKLDAMLFRTIDYDVTVDPTTGRVRSTVTVTMRNEAPTRGLPSTVLANRLGKPAGTNSTTLAVYTPLDLVDVRRDGRGIGRSASEDHGRYRYTALVDVPPQSEVTVTFELEGLVDVRGGYRLDVVPQPMVNADLLHVDVRGAGGWITNADPRSVALDQVERIEATFRRWP